MAKHRSTRTVLCNKLLQKLLNDHFIEYVLVKVAKRNVMELSLVVVYPLAVLELSEK